MKSNNWNGNNSQLCALHSLMWTFQSKYITTTDLTENKDSWCDNFFGCTVRLDKSTKVDALHQLNLDTSRASMSIYIAKTIMFMQLFKISRHHIWCKMQAEGFYSIKKNFCMPTLPTQFTHGIKSHISMVSSWKLQ